MCFAFSTPSSHTLLKNHLIFRARRNCRYHQSLWFSNIFEPKGEFFESYQKPIWKTDKRRWSGSRWAMGQKATHTHTHTHTRFSHSSLQTSPSECLSAVKQWVQTQWKTHAVLCHQHVCEAGLQRSKQIDLTFPSLHWGSDLTPSTPQTHLFCKCFLNQRKSPFMGPLKTSPLSLMQPTNIY